MGCRQQAVIPARTADGESDVKGRKSCAAYRRRGPAKKRVRTTVTP